MAEGGGSTPWNIATAVNGLPKPTIPSAHAYSLGWSPGSGIVSLSLEFSRGFL